MEKRKLKVLWALHGPHFIFTQTAEHLAKYCDLTLTFGDSPAARVIPEKGFRIIYLPKLDRELQFIFVPQHLNNLFSKKKIDTSPMVYLKGLRRTIDAVKPDVVIGLTCYMPVTWDAALYCKKKGIPFVLETEMHTPPQSVAARAFMKLVRTLIGKAMYGKAKFILPYTKRGVAFALKNFPIKNPKNIRLLPAGVDTKVYKPPRHASRKGPMRILVVARYVHFKRQADVLQALQSLYAHGFKEWELTLRGSGDLEQQIKDQVNKSIIKDKVVFAPRIASDKMAAFYASFDLVILPSYNEPIGMVVPEAMACGIPVIVSDTVGASTYVREGIDGLIYPTGDIAALAACIRRMGDKNLRQRMGAAAAKSIKEKYSLEIIGKQFYALLVEAVTRRD